MSKRRGYLSITLIIIIGALAVVTLPVFFGHFYRAGAGHAFRKMYYAHRLSWSTMTDVERAPYQAHAAREGGEVRSSHVSRTTHTALSPQHDYDWSAESFDIAEISTPSHLWLLFGLDNRSAVLVAGCRVLGARDLIPRIPWARVPVLPLCHISLRHYPWTCQTLPSVSQSRRSLSTIESRISLRTQQQGPRFFDTGST
jgi:hypothetical protein